MRRKVLWSIALAFAACGGSEGSVDAGACSFAGAPLLTLPSDSGKLEVAVRSCPQPPVLGVDTFELTVTDAHGVAQDGLSLAVLPWMPSMAHGVGTSPVVTAAGGGSYVVSSVYLDMQGSWQLQTQISGPVNDSVTPTIDIP
ncbi:MAG: FixH family protein [Myxococcales bacterium]